MEADQTAKHRGISPRAKPIEADTPLTGIMLGLPCYGGIAAAFLHGFAGLRNCCADLNIPFHFITVHNESLVQRARNRCVAEFLASDASHLLFVDTDIGFSAAGVMRLLAHDVPLIGGLYRRKQMDRVEWVWNRLPPHQEKRNPETGAISCAAVGTGFMLIRRDVITSIVEASMVTGDDGVRRSPLRYYTATSDGDPGPWRDYTFSVFDCFTDETGNYLSEDYAFCRRWRDLGGDVWADPGVLLEHVGLAAFKADPLEYV